MCVTTPDHPFVLHMLLDRLVSPGVRNSVSNTLEMFAKHCEVNSSKTGLDLGGCEEAFQKLKFAYDLIYENYRRFPSVEKDKHKQDWLEVVRTVLTGYFVSGRGPNGNSKMLIPAGSRQHLIGCLIDYEHKSVVLCNTGAGLAEFHKQTHEPSVSEEEFFGIIKCYSAEDGVTHGDFLQKMVELAADLLDFRTDRIFTVRRSEIEPFYRVIVAKHLSPPEFVLSQNIEPVFGAGIFDGTGSGRFCSNIRSHLLSWNWFTRQDDKSTVFARAQISGSCSFHGFAWLLVLLSGSRREMVGFEEAMHKETVAALQIKHETEKPRYQQQLNEMIWAARAIWHEHPHLRDHMALKKDQLVAGVRTVPTAPLLEGGPDGALVTRVELASYQQFFGHWVEHPVETQNSAALQRLYTAVTHILVPSKLWDDEERDPISAPALASMFVVKKAVCRIWSEELDKLPKQAATLPQIVRATRLLVTGTNVFVMCIRNDCHLENNHSQSPTAPLVSSLGFQHLREALALYVLNGLTRLAGRNSSCVRPLPEKFILEKSLHLAATEYLQSSATVCFRILRQPTEELVSAVAQYLWYVPTLGPDRDPDDPAVFDGIPALGTGVPERLVGVSNKFRAVFSHFSDALDRNVSLQVATAVLVSLGLHQGVFNTLVNKFFQPSPKPPCNTLLELDGKSSVTASVLMKEEGESFSYGLRRLSRGIPPHLPSTGLDAMLLAAAGPELVSGAVTETTLLDALSVPFFRTDRENRYPQDHAQVLAWRSETAQLLRAVCDSGRQWLCSCPLPVFLFFAARALDLFPPSDRGVFGKIAELRSDPASRRQAGLPTLEEGSPEEAALLSLQVSADAPPQENEVLLAKLERYLVESVREWGPIWEQGGIEGSGIWDQQVGTAPLSYVAAEMAADALTLCPQLFDAPARVFFAQYKPKQTEMQTVRNLPAGSFNIPSTFARGEEDVTVETGPGRSISLRYPGPTLELTGPAVVRPGSLVFKHNDRRLGEVTGRLNGMAHNVWVNEGGLVTVECRAGFTVLLGPPATAGGPARIQIGGGGAGLGAPALEVVPPAEVPDALLCWAEGWPPGAAAFFVRYPGELLPRLLWATEAELWFTRQSIWNSRSSRLNSYQQEKPAVLLLPMHPSGLFPVLDRDEDLRTLYNAAEAAANTVCIHRLWWQASARGVGAEARPASPWGKMFPLQDGGRGSGSPFSEAVLRGGTTEKVLGLPDHLSDLVHTDKKHTGVLTGYTASYSIRPQVTPEQIRSIMVLVQQEHASVLGAQHTHTVLGDQFLRPDPELARRACWLHATWVALRKLLALHSTAAGPAQLAAEVRRACFRLVPANLAPALTTLEQPWRLAVESGGFFLTKEQASFLSAAGSGPHVQHLGMGQGKSTVIMPALVLRALAEDRERERRRHILVVQPEHLVAAAARSLVRCLASLGRPLPVTVTAHSGPVPAADLAPDSPAQHVHVISDTNFKHTLLRIRTGLGAAEWGPADECIRSAVVIHDEVDACLDPLRSNLNITTGQPVPHPLITDRSGPELDWYCRAVFAAAVPGRRSAPEAPAGLADLARKIEVDQQNAREHMTLNVHFGRAADPDQLLAVPYTAARTPAPVGTMFSDPDVRALLTCLQKSREGLGQGDFRLLQHYLFSLPFGSSRTLLEDFAQTLVEEEEGKKMVGKGGSSAREAATDLLSLSPEKLGVLRPGLALDPALVEFYVTTVLLPARMRYYPTRLNISYQDTLTEEVGSVKYAFSGTVGATIPRQLGRPGTVFGQEPREDKVSSAAARAAILGDEAQQQQQQLDPPVTDPRDFITRAATHRVACMIDAAAVLYDVSVVRVASELFQQRPEVAALVHFHPGTGLPVRIRREGSGGTGGEEVWYFDHRNTRGTDAVLPPLSTALVSVGPANTFTDVVQAVFRLRDVLNGQSACFLLFGDWARDSEQQVPGTRRELLARLEQNEQKKKEFSELHASVQNFKAHHRRSVEYSPASFAERVFYPLLTRNLSDVLSVGTDGRPQDTALTQGPLLETARTNFEEINKIRLGGSAPEPNRELEVQSEEQQDQLVQLSNTHQVKTDIGSQLCVSPEFKNMTQAYVTQLHNLKPQELKRVVVGRDLLLESYRKEFEDLGIFISPSLLLEDTVQPAGSALVVEYLGLHQTHICTSREFLAGVQVNSSPLPAGRQKVYNKEGFSLSASRKRSSDWRVLLSCLLAGGSLGPVLEAAVLRGAFEHKPSPDDPLGLWPQAWNSLNCFYDSNSDSYSPLLHMILKGSQFAGLDHGTRHWQIGEHLRAMGTERFSQLFVGNSQRIRPELNRFMTRLYEKVLKYFPDDRATTPRPVKRRRGGGNKKKTNPELKKARTDPPPPKPSNSLFRSAVLEQGKIINNNTQKMTIAK